jgi:hypothetical protein
MDLTKENWSDIWTEFEDGTKQPYLSTLIIPMSISKDKEINDDYEKEYNKKFFKSDKATLWGFLCIDHSESDFFKNIEEEKNFKCEDLGYIFSDIISLYLMFMYNHIAGSRTVQRYTATIQ